MNRPTHDTKSVLFICGLLALATAAAYWPAQHCAFLNFDDPDYVTGNDRVRAGLTWPGVVWAFEAFTPAHAGNWHPLTWISHMMDCQFFGLHPAAHHLTNLLLHIINALLLFLAFKQMTGALGRSAFVAALFALHPLHVESVAWVSERKDVLSTFFFMLTLLAYVRYARLNANVGSKRASWWLPAAGHGSGNYWLAVLLFALGLMSKPMLVTLPLVFLLLDWWPLQRLSGAEAGSAKLAAQTSARALLIEKLPFIALSAIVSVITFLAERSTSRLEPVQPFPFAFRAGNALISYVRYLGKTLWPADLITFYPYPSAWPSWQVVGAALLLTMMTALAVWCARRHPYVLVGWLWFMGMLMPVIGFVQAGMQCMADRYTYLPLIGIFLIVVWGVTDLPGIVREQRVATGGNRFGRWLLVSSGVIVLIACGVLTHTQTLFWRDSVTLFTRAVQVAPTGGLAQHNLGHALSLVGDDRAAISHFEEALRLLPGYARVHYNLANSLGVLGNLDEAIRHYREAIRLKPDYEKAYYQLGNALALKGELSEAEENFRAALRYKPGYAEAHTRLANLLVLRGRAQEALKEYAAALAIRPDYEEAHFRLARELARQQRFSDAATHFQAAIKAKPDHAPALNELAWILVSRSDPQLRNVPEGLAFAQTACRLTSDRNAAYLDTLAFAHAEAGQFNQAVAVAEKAVETARAAGESAMATELSARLECYRQNRSYREFRQTRRTQ